MRRIQELELLKSRQGLIPMLADELASLRAMAGIEMPPRLSLRRRQQRPRRPAGTYAGGVLTGLGLAVAAFLLLVFIGLPLLLQNAAPSYGNYPHATALPASWVTTHEFTGSAYKRTEPFTATGPWRVNWSCNPTGEYASTFSITLYDPADYADLLVNGVNLSGGDTTSVYRSGTFSLDIQALNTSWVVQVQEPR